MYIKHILFFILLCQITNVHSQTNEVNTSISISDTADIVVLSVFPDSFPNVSVLFKAETRNNEPIWNLEKSKMLVKEDDESCNIISLEQVSKNKPINIGVVFDHSGSMQISDSISKDTLAMLRLMYGAPFSLIFPDNYVAPIDNAKKAVNEFVESFNSNKDYISLIGFSSVVDTRLPLSQDIANVKSVINSFKAERSTALYDAMMESIESVSDANGIKVLVVLTDGNDNSSNSTWHDVVKEASKDEIPIFIIGLGDVNVDTLQAIADSTKGQFYYTEKSESLASIYSDISKQVQAFYSLVYRSPNLAAADTSRQIELSFEIDSLYLMPNSTKMELPEEVITYMAKKERERSYYIKGGVAAVVVVSIGVLLLYFRRKSAKS
jgi:Ca-activated chloride channel family protein